MGQIFAGLLIFILSQYFLKLHLNPYKDYCDVRSKISFISIRNYGNLVSDSESNKNLADEINETSASLISKYNSIWFTNFFAKCDKYGLPNQAEIKRASQKLNIIAAEMRKSKREPGLIHDLLREVEQILKIDINAGRRNHKR